MTTTLEDFHRINSALKEIRASNIQQRLVNLHQRRTGCEIDTCDGQLCGVVESYQLRSSTQDSINKYDLKRLTKAFLNHSELSQFKDHPDCLKIEEVEPGYIDLKLTNFPGLKTNVLHQRLFRTLELPNIKLTHGHISSGGPEGIVVRYGYTFLNDMLDEPVTANTKDGPGEHFTKTEAYKEAYKSQIGRSWNSTEGKKTITDVTVIEGKPRLVVSVEGSRIKTFYPPEEIERTILVDENWYSHDIKSKQAKLEQDSLTKQAKAKKQNLNGFITNMPAIKQRKVEEVLDTLVRYKGVPITRRELIERKVKEGWTIEQHKTGRRFNSPDGYFQDEKMLTKTGMDYAEFLLNHR